MMAEVYAGGVVALVSADTLDEVLEEAKRMDKRDARWGGVRKIILLERERAVTGGVRS